MFPQRNPLWKFLYCNKIPAKKFAEKNAGKFSEKIPMGKLCRVPSKFFGEVPSGKKTQEIPIRSLQLSQPQKELRPWEPENL